MRAVIYCRVSMEEEVQVNALKSQVGEAIAAVKKQKWTLIDEYVDEGKTGTTTAKRNADFSSPFGRKQVISPYRWRTCHPLSGWS